MLVLVLRVPLRAHMLTALRSKLAMLDLDRASGKKAVVSPYNIGHGVMEFGPASGRRGPEGFIVYMTIDVFCCSVLQYGSRRIGFVEHRFHPCVLLLDFTCPSRHL